jgi:hypothetical protein
MGKGKRMSCWKLRMRCLGLGDRGGSTSAIAGMIANAINGDANIGRCLYWDRQGCKAGWSQKLIMSSAWADYKGCRLKNYIYPLKYWVYLNIK